MKRITLLGSTGSVGTQTLQIVRETPDFKIAALAAKTHIDLLEKQIREFLPSFAAVYDEKAAEELRVRVSDLPVRIGTGMEGLVEASVLDETDFVIPAITGTNSIRPTVAAIEAGKEVGLVNKEALVTAGHLIMPAAKKQGVRVVPIDSEHSAVYQCLKNGTHDEVSRLILTASGGPFRGMTSEQLEKVTAADALKHPNWSMGDKITIDSATLVNKGLEVCEAGWLFGFPADQIEVVIQPQSIVHSMVEFRDGAVLAQLSLPDMRLPIQYALTDPGRAFLSGERLDFGKLRKITFEPVDTNVFRGLSLAYEAIRAGGSMTTVFNASNEAAVRRFLRGEISLPGIYSVIEKAMGMHRVIASPSLEEILSIEKEILARFESE
ncbi:MAG: 1-deoxy-D-xylulose-5-phosphate reductoisomerase [Eubacterium sp.]|nr:1-deoxy-D-xylulose-5-phosphate reductoisomerase [Eubacterium sp.]